jgi:hypothetical protein
MYRAKVIITSLIMAVPTGELMPRRLLPMNT